MEKQVSTELTSAPERRGPRISLFARILFAMAVGTLTGLVLGRRAAPLGEIGSVIIGLIKTLAAPLLFFAVVDAFLRTTIRLRSGLIMLGITLTNATLAILIGLTLSNTIRPGDHLTITLAESGPGSAHEAKIGKLDFTKELIGYIPSSVVRPFLDNTIISIILLALMAGVSLRQVKNRQLREGDDSYQTVEKLVATLYQALEITLGGIVAFVPLAVFGVVSKMVGQEGFRPFVGLAVYVGVAVLGLAIQVLVVYQAWIFLVARMPLRRFWSGARDAIVYAMGASSSLATLPVTLRCLDRMKVSPQSARLAACVGTNLNNDGILLYEAMAVLFVAQVYGIELSLSQQLLAAASCTLAGIGIAAVPDAGLISLALVLATVGLPGELLGLLLTVDWFLSRCRAMTNVASDMVVAVLLDHFEQEPAEEMTTGPTSQNEAGPDVVEEVLTG